MFLRLFAIGSGLGIGLLIPTESLAQNLSGIANTVSGGLPSFGGGMQAIVSAVSLIIKQLTLLVDVLATLMIVAAGLKLIYRAADDQMEAAKRTIAGSAVAVMLVHLTPRFVDAFYGQSGAAGGTVLEGNVSEGASVLSAEVLGIVAWAEVIVATAAVLTIIISGLKAIVNYGDESGVQQLYRTVFAVVAGILLVVLKRIIVATFGLPTEGIGLPGSPNISRAIAKGVDIVEGLLLFTALVAVAVIVYGGITMILSIGKEDQFGNAKNLVIRVSIGLVVILVSLMLVQFVENIVV